MRTYEIKLTFLRDLLGSQPSNPDIKRKYITGKLMTGRTGMSSEIAVSKIEEEIDNQLKDEALFDRVSDISDSTLTIFFRNKDGLPCLSDIQIRGFIKDAFAFVGKDTKLLKKKAKKGEEEGEAYTGEATYRKWIGERIRFPEQYYPIDRSIDVFERPIRVVTQQGQRVSIASSERMQSPIDNPIKLTFKLIAYDEVTPEIMKMIFDRGLFKGISQWGNSGMGTFTYELKEI